MKIFSTSALCVAALLITTPPSVAAPQRPNFARIFADHAVLQRDTPVRLWGETEPYQPLQVQIAGQKLTTTADADGHWQVNLAPLPAGGPYSLTLSDDQGLATALTDIMIGDVWLCSGQSNMEFLTKYASNAQWEVLRSENPALRYAVIERDAESAPLADLKTPVTWRMASQADTGDSSAVCYFMAKSLQKSQGVTIGMIQSSWGGTVAQTWISEQGLRRLTDYDAYLDALKRYSQAPDQARGIWSNVAAQWWQANEPDGKAKVAWSELNFNDSQWESLKPEGIWEDSGRADLATFDGVVYFRTTLTLTAEQAKNGTQINLGPVDDSDTTWVNGVYVGGMDLWETPRSYVVPKGVLRTGKNVITVRVLDLAGGGGLRGKTSERSLDLSDGSKIALPAQWRYKISAPIGQLKTPPTTPWQVPNGLTMLYNGMIAPVTRYNIKGVAWYQGESNTDSPPAYARLLPALIDDWRLQFQHKDMPFLMVQLANFGPTPPVESEKSSWAEVREIQRQTARDMKNVGMAVTIDVGDRFDIHPAQKGVVGYRLALAAQKIAYGEAVNPDGPEPVSITRAGPDLIVTYKNTSGGLHSYGSKSASGFEVCDASNRCSYVIGLTKNDTIVLKDANAPAVTKVRYAWANAPYVNLYNGLDLPATPFEFIIQP